MGTLVPIHLPGHARRVREREIRERVELHVAETETVERIRAQVLAEREAAAEGPERVTVARMLAGSAWRNRAFLAPFAALPPLAVAGWASFWVLLLWVGLSGWWWSRGNLPRDWQEPAPEIEPEPLPLPDTIPNRWATNLAAEGRTLAGSEIVDVQVLPHADRYRVQLVPGRQTVEGVGDSLGLVASGLQTPKAKIVWEPDPDLAEEDSTVGRLTIVRRNVSKEIRYFRRPVIQDGVVLLGDHIDLDGQAGWTVYGDNSIRGGLIAGTTDYGKSRFLDCLCASVMSPEFQERWPTHILYVDGQGGASSPLLAENATLTVGPEDADDAVQAILRMGDARRAWNIANGVEGFNPGVSPCEGVEGLAGWLIVVDESHDIWPHGKAEPWARIARGNRKLGQAIVSSGHVTDLSGFGEDDALRSSLLRGNCVVFRIESMMAKSRIPGLATSPAEFPKIRGYFQTVPGADIGGRAAPARGWYSPNEKEITKAAAKGQPVPGDVPSLEAQFARAVRPPVCDMDAKALGVLYARREERAAYRRQVAAAVANGREVPEMPEEIRLTRRPALAVVGAVAEPSEEQVTTTRGAILAHLRKQGDATKAQLVEHVKTELGTSESAVTKALTALVAAQEITRAGDGNYRLGNAA